jgi:polyhydroxybutyrate depolymerase
MRVLAALILFFAAVVPAMACGADSDCELGDRSYRIYLPERKAGEPLGAVIFAHGYRGTASQIIGDRSLTGLANELHVALVAPQAVDGDWQLPNRPRQKGTDGAAEWDYFKRLVDDIGKRFGIDRRKLLATGFSSGGMLVWNLACHEGDLFAGFAPISGTFWAPVPDGCPGPAVSLIHFHGTSDTVVPLEGRKIADAKQGGVSNALALFTKIGHFGGEHPMPAQDLDCMRRENPAGKILDLCTHPGGHGYKADYVRRAWREMHIGGR